MPAFFRTNKTKALNQKYEELNELVETILPQCQDRISICNYVAYLIQVMHRDIETLTREQAKESGIDCPKQMESPDPILAPLPYEETTMDLTKDIEFLKDLIGCTSSSYIKARLTAMQYYKEDQLKKMKRQNRKEQRALQKKRSSLRIVPANGEEQRQKDVSLEQVLYELKDRPYVCKLLAVREGNIDYLADLSSSIVADPESTSRERWVDASRIDEVIDNLFSSTSTKTPCNIRDSLYEIKNHCREEAKRMMKDGNVMMTKLKRNSTGGSIDLDLPLELEEHQGLGRTTTYPRRGSFGTALVI